VFFFLFFQKIFLSFRENGILKQEIEV